MFLSINREWYTRSAGKNEKIKKHWKMSLSYTFKYIIKCNKHTLFGFVIHEWWLTTNVTRKMTTKAKIFLMKLFLRYQSLPMFGLCTTKSNWILATSFDCHWPLLPMNCFWCMWISKVINSIALESNEWPSVKHTL